MLPNLATRIAGFAVGGLLLAGLWLPPHAGAQGNDNGRGRHKQLYAVPAPGKVVIDGKLEDWDLSGQIEMFVIQATRSTMNAKFAVMYDAEALYLGANVNDPSPMMNLRDPRTDPSQGWNADSCQFRLTTDPQVGYPILDESTFKYKGQGDPSETRDDIVHLTLWHYTVTGEPQLAMQQGMTFRAPQNAPRGLVPQDQFQAKYRQRADGTGYAFEYRIPWKTLNAKRPLTGGDVVAGTVQFNYSRPDGQMTAGGAAWAYDLMREPGFPFQSTRCWGKLIFSPTGQVDRHLVLEGVPPDRPLPLEFSYTLPEDTECTIQIFNEQHENVRILVPQQQRLGGPNTERWDGCDDSGNLLPAGTYKWRGIYHAPVKAEYRFSVHNSGQPPYPTADGKGGWGGDHGTPQTACAFDGGMLLAWNASEYGWGVIRTDFAGRKQWGCNYDATHLATDGQSIFSAGGHGFTRSNAIQLMTAREARPIQLGDQDHIAAPAGGDDKTNLVTGLACDGKELLASYQAGNLIARFNPQDGALLGTWDVPSPERLTALPQGRVAVISGGKLLILKDGKTVATIADKLDEPTAVACFEDLLFAANRGSRLMNVSVFDLGGKYLRSIGKPGGRPAKGRYDPLGIYMPGGISVDKHGQLWVAETTDAPKRISVWDARTGAFKHEFFGSCEYFGYGYIDPAKTDEILVHNVLWKVDWKTYQVTPQTTVWRKTAPEMIPYLGAGSYAASPKIITAANGRQYMYGHNYAHFSGLFYRDGDLFQPLLSKIHVGYDYIGPAGIPFMDNDRAKYPQGQYFWQDQNGDGCVQPEEVTPLKGTPFENFAVGWVFPDLTMLANGRLLKPVSVTNGRPKYDLSKSEKYPLPFGYSAVPSADGGVCTYTPAKGVALARYDQAGNKLWSYSGIGAWHDALNLGVTGPGKLWGMTQCMGQGGDFLVFQTYFGPNHVFRADGLYVGALLKDGRLMLNRGQDEGQPEGQGGYFGRLSVEAGQPERYFLIGGGQDARVWEVVGLDTIKDLPGGTYVHASELAAKAELAQREYRLALAAARQIVIGKDLVTAKSVEKEWEAGRAFQVKLAHDDQHLQLEYEVNSNTPLVNAVPDPKLLFKGGNCLDVQLENSRGEPVRVLVTRYQGKPFAALYFPKVKDFQGEPTVFNSPTGKESFDEIRFLENIALVTEPTDKGFRARVALPLAALRLELKPGRKLKLDLGYIYGNAQGVGKAVRRVYLFNNSFSANVLDDIPNESRLEPKEWGEAAVD